MEDADFTISLIALLIAALSFLMNLRVFVTPEMLDSKLSDVYKRFDMYQSKDSCNNRHNSIEGVLDEIKMRLGQITDFLLNQKKGDKL
ncbi:MAG: hypothetical protein ACOC22_02170 [bacterium]